MHTQCFSTRGESAGRGYLTMSGDILSCQSWPLSCGWRPGMLLTTVRGTGQPHQNDLSQMSGPLLKCWWMRRYTHISSTPGWGERGVILSPAAARGGSLQHPPGTQCSTAPLPGCLPLLHTSPCSDFIWKHFLTIQFHTQSSPQDHLQGNPT